MNCTVVCFTTIPFCADGGDLCEADDSKLATARARKPQLSPHFSEASHVAKMVFSIPASLLKVEKLQPSPLNLVKRPEADGRAVPQPHSLFPERHLLAPERH